MDFRTIYEQGKTDVHTAFELFDKLEAVELESLVGTWKGKEFYTGHPLDGVLKKLNWYGKAFHDAENVDPLLFRGLNGNIFAVDPVPFMDLRKLVKAPGGKARMRMMEYRGKVSGTMIYDNLPIHDHFRKVNDSMLLGVMDWKGAKQAYFFVLEKVE
ncbi:DUF4334 domain-containing protein [Planococcus salinus]|uniref:DUF4334 domain-containing protein n=2 Tax=Planococcus salinus TaxID=1848460 RepID=A0A3M8P8C3_9BACL|nr:DUF4334 domain-containing protein [Planococcus salinus]